MVAQSYDTVLIGDAPTASLTLEVDCDFFSVYGLTGRSPDVYFTRACAPGSEEHVLVLSNESWCTCFAADRKSWAGQSG